jgi:hypothetical protein
MSNGPNIFAMSIFQGKGIIREEVNCESNQEVKEMHHTAPSLDFWWGPHSPSWALL